MNVNIGVDATKAVTSSSDTKHPEGIHKAAVGYFVLPRVKKTAVPLSKMGFESSSRRCTLEIAGSYINSPLNLQSLEQKLSCVEVYSTKYMPELMDEYEVLVRKEEKQIKCEEEKMSCETEINEFSESINQRTSWHFKMTQVLIVRWVLG